MWRILLVLLLVCSCKSTKKSISEEFSAEQHISSEISSMKKSADLAAVLSVDSLMLTLSADSIITPSGAVVYKPAVALTAKGASAEVAKNEEVKAEAERTDSTSVESMVARDEEANAEISPLVSLKCWWAVALAALALVFLLTRRMK